jgi:hypothetical protein
MVRAVHRPWAMSLGFKPQAPQASTDIYYSLTTGPLPPLTLQNKSSIMRANRFSFSFVKDLNLALNQHYSFREKFKLGDFNSPRLSTGFEKVTLS